MPTTYVKRDTNSDLSSGGNHNKVLNETTAALVTLVITVPQASSVEGYHFTESGIPGADGVTGDYTVELNVTTAQNDIQVAVTVARVDSSGTVQSESTLSAEQQAVAGVMTFNLTSVDLGTWATGDRLRVRHRFRNTHQHSSRDIEVGWNTTDSEVVAPWSTAAPLALGTVTESESVQPLTVTSALPLGTVTETEAVQPLTLGTGGGTTYSESFDQADSTTLGPDLTWTEVLNDWETQSNAAEPVTDAGASTPHRARAEHDLATDDHYSEAPIEQYGASGRAGVCVRYDAAADTCYWGHARDSSTNTFEILKAISGTVTVISKVGDTAPATPFTVRMEVDGSTLSLKVDGTEVLTDTDTEITGNIRTGIYGEYWNFGSTRLSSFEAGDLGAVALTLGTVTETESARPLTISSTLTLGTVTETETAQPVTVTSTGTLAAAVEAESAQPLTVTSVLPLGTAVETESAGTFTADSTLPFNTATETESAQPLTVTSTATLSTVTETETARPFTIAGELILGTVTETESAGTLSVTSTATLGTATESETGRPLTVTSTLPLGTVTEAETAVAFTMAAPILTLGTVTETESAQPFTVTSTGTLGTAVETEQAGTVTVTSGLPLATVTESESAGTFTVTATVPLATVVESEAAQPLVLLIPDTAAAITIVVREPSGATVTETSTTAVVQEPSAVTVNGTSGPTVREPAHTTTVQES